MFNSRTNNNYNNDLTRLNLLNILYFLVHFLWISHRRYHKCKTLVYLLHTQLYNKNNI